MRHRRVQLALPALLFVMSGLSFGQARAANAGGIPRINGKPDMTGVWAGPGFKFTEAISLLVTCETQEEIDEKWEKLSEGGAKSQCGWLKDKFGLSWQIVPPILGEMLQDKDPEKSKRVMAAMMTMTKIEIDKLKQAYKGSGL